MTEYSKYSASCGECGSAMELQRGTYGRFWSCSRWPKCTGTHGAHPDGKPFGTPANAATRRARVEAHAAFDRLWQREPGERRLMSRKQAYRWLQETMQLLECDAHIGQFTIAQCDRLIRAVANHLDPDPCPDPATTGETTTPRGT